MSEFRVRSALVEDAGIIARHRASMFEEMRQLPADVFDTLRRDAEAFLRRLGFAATNEMRFAGELA